MSSWTELRDDAICGRWRRRGGVDEVDEDGQCLQLADTVEVAGGAGAVWSPWPGQPGLHHGLRPGGLR